MVKRIRRVLLATDLTPASDRAFDRAIRIAQSTGASLSVFHAVDTSLLQATFVKRELREAKTSLLRDMRECADKSAPKMFAHVAGGDPDVAIVDRAKIVGADLIVMGAPDYRKLASAFRGTTVDRVVRTAPCPVLAVKQRPRQDYRSIAAALDFSSSSQAALEFVLRAFPRTEVHVIHVDEGGATRKRSAREETGTRDQIDRILRDCCRAAGRAEPGAPGGPTMIVKHGTAGDDLRRTIDRLAPDLVVMGTHGRKGVARLILGSVAEMLLNTSRCDMLVVRA